MQVVMKARKDGQENKWKKALQLLFKKYWIYPNNIQKYVANEQKYGSTEEVKHSIQTLIKL